MSEVESPARPFPVIERAQWLAWAIAALLLVLIIELHLLPALLGGLTVYSLVHLMTPHLKFGVSDHDRRRWLALGLVATAVVAVLIGLGVGIATFFRGSGESIPELFQRMATIIEQSKERLPDWLIASLPDDADDLRRIVADWLREHGRIVQAASAEALRGFAHLLIGMVVGAMLALLTPSAHSELPSAPLTRVLAQQASHLADVFRRVVFAQVWISTINTLLTWAYLGLVLPMLDIHLPLTKSLVALTFVAGLMPILGNLLSNTAIFVVSMSQSLGLAVASLVYLFFIHKLEYFLNARIIGSHIRARAWELLLAMLLMEAAFGIGGLILAPVVYAYFKDEFRRLGLI